MDMIEAILGYSSGVRAGVEFISQGHDGVSNRYLQTNSINTLRAEVEAWSTTADGKVSIRFLRVGTDTVAQETSDNGEHTPTWDEPLLYRWDDGTGQLFIVINGTEYEIATGINDQADLITFFESVYDEGDWDFAYDTATGDIIVTWVGDGSGSWNFSESLSESINLSDEVAAWIVTKDRYRREWSS